MDPTVNGGEPSLAAEQRRTVLGMATALVTAALAIVVAPRWWPHPLPDGADPVTRLSFVILCDVFVFVWVVAIVGRIASQRFLSAKDIAGSGLTVGGPTIRRTQAVLQNTLEQAAIAAPAHLALALLIPGHWLAILPVLVILFGLGRFFFWLGYAGGAGSRTFGFGLTFYPTVAAYVWAVSAIVSRG